MKQTFLLFYLIVIFLFPSCVGAQIQFQQVLPQPPAPQITSDFDILSYSSIAFADIDNDNDEDVLTSGIDAYGQPLTKLYSNDGSGIYTEVTSTPFDNVANGSMVFADIDNDNDIDVFITGYNSSNQSTAKLYTNDGNGVFTEVTATPFEEVSGSSVAFSDVDGDNDQDIFITGLNNSNQSIAKLYINDGSGVFTENTGTSFEGVFNGSIAFADIDSDGDQDLMITGRNLSPQYISKLYINDGNAVFTESTGTPFQGVANSSIAFADIDGDNDQDFLITGEIDEGFQNIAKLYLNNGLGNFTEDSGTSFIGVKQGSIAFSDVDGDNDRDVLISGEVSNGIIINKLYFNDGSGVFTESTGTPFQGVVNSSIAFADIDGDNDQDVLITGETDGGIVITKLYVNDGNGFFVEGTGSPFKGVFDSSTSFADIDGDNDQDVLITGANTATQYSANLYINDGNGGFTEATGTPFEGVKNGSTAFADIDGDNDCDVLITGINSSLQRVTNLYINDGNGVFSESVGTPFEGVGDSSIAFADIDGDNHRDVLITGTNSSLQRVTNLYINDGNGVFTQVTGTPFDGVADSSIDFADIDNDNDQDVLITGINNNSQRIAKLYTNDGSGNFTEVTGTSFEGVYLGSIVFADIDGDNDQDVFIIGANFSFQSLANLYINDGNGIFTEATGTPFEGVNYGSLDIADVDGDNDQDVLISGRNSSNQRITKLYTNYGNGTFEENTEIQLDGVWKGSVAFEDIDDDNDHDVLITGRNFRGQIIAKLYRNESLLSFEDNTYNSKFTIYPNPVHDVLSIKSLDYNDKLKVVVFDLLGHEIISKQLDLINNQAQLNISVLEKGLYLVKLIGDKNTSITRKIVKK